MDMKKEANFAKYCPLCKEAKRDEHEDPCNECLQYPAQLWTTKPIYFKEAK